tara:strand:+ start:726 stop:1028 length:303 start_codon:yes stop_codon:yes gene_type:complete
MQNNKRYNLKRKDISNEIHSKYGISISYADKFIEDTFKVIIYGLKKYNTLKIKNFGTFKVISKKKRIGRNPKTKKTYEITERKSLSFKTSNLLKKKINNE